MTLAPARSDKIAWHTATVESIVVRTPTVKSFFFRFEEPPRFIAGQHMDVRLTAPDGYQAQRSYSIASAPESNDAIELAIERLEDGEVSPFFHDIVAVGDEIELRGPIGGHFRWSVEDGGPVLLVGGGSGVVPLACMIRHRAHYAGAAPVALVYSARTVPDVIFHEELRALSDRNEGFAYFPTLTRQLEPAAGLRLGRIGASIIRDALAALSIPPKVVYVCGSNAFVEAASATLIALGIPAETIRTERYG
jgi:ferredoxin-NADP reductase